MMRWCSWTIKKAFSQPVKMKEKQFRGSIFLGFAGWKKKPVALTWTQTSFSWMMGLVSWVLVWCDLTEYPLILCVLFLGFCFVLFCGSLFSHWWPNKVLEKTLWSSRCVLIGLKMLNIATRLVFLVVLRTRSLLKMMRNKHRECWQTDQFLIYQRSMICWRLSIWWVTWLIKFDKPTHEFVWSRTRCQANISQTSFSSIAGNIIAVKHSNSTTKSRSMNTTQLFQAKDSLQANFLPPNQMWGYCCVKTKANVFFSPKNKCKQNTLFSFFLDHWMAFESLRYNFVDEKLSWSRNIVTNEQEIQKKTISPHHQQIPSFSTRNVSVLFVKLAVLIENSMLIWSGVLTFCCSNTHQQNTVSWTQHIFLSIHVAWSYQSLKLCNTLLHFDPWISPTFDEISQIGLVCEVWSASILEVRRCTALTAWFATYGGQSDFWGQCVLSCCEPRTDSSQCMLDCPQRWDFLQAWNSTLQ